MRFFTLLVAINFCKDSETACALPELIPLALHGTLVWLKQVQLLKPYKQIQSCQWGSYADKWVNVSLIDSTKVFRT